MAIKGFKDIIDKRGYRVDKKDREIFERALAKSAFGIRLDNIYRHGKTDMVEFVLYDSNDNQLPQGESGDLVRYIYLDDANIGEYFTIDETQRKLNDAPKYIVNSEKLIREAGYSSGIFKTQITLLNRRMGSEKGAFDKVWIHEISPSRTEIRVLPTKNASDRVLPDLQERYDIFVNGGEFRDDVILGLFPFIQSIDTQRVYENILKLKGSVASGQTYINLIKKEFKVQNFEAMLGRIKNKFIEAMSFYAANRDWNIDSKTYGRPLAIQPPLSLSVDKLFEIACDVMRKVIDKELPNQNLQAKPELSFEEQVTYDKLQKILETATSNTTYSATVPAAVAAARKPIRGCTDRNALNYNPDAEEDDGTCRYAIVSDGTTNTEPKPQPQDPILIRGCTDPNALNYDPLATINEGCKYKVAEPETITETYYSWCAEGGYIRYTNRDGQTVTSGIVANGFSITIRYLAGTTPYFSCEFGLYPKKNPEVIYKCNDPAAVNYGEIGDCEYGLIRTDSGELVPASDYYNTTNNQYLIRSTPVDNTATIWYQSDVIFRDKEIIYK